MMKCLAFFSDFQISYQIEILRHTADAGSVGSAICEKAVKLDAVAVVLSKHTKSVTDEYWLEFYVGSVT